MGKKQPFWSKSVQKTSKFTKKHSKNAKKQIFNRTTVLIMAKKAEIFLQEYSL